MNDEINRKITENKPLVYFVLKRYFRKFSQDEDAYSAGLVGLWRALNKFDESKNVKFSTFATKCIYNEICKEFLHKRVKYNSKYKQIIERFADDDADFLFEKEVDPHDYFYNNEDYQKLINVLPTCEKEIIHRVISNDEQLSDIAREKKCTKSQIGYLYHRGLRRIENQVFGSSLNQPTTKPKQAGEAHHSAKLTWAQVVEARQKFATGKFTKKKLANEYGVSSPSMSLLLRGRTWTQAP